MSLYAKRGVSAQKEEVHAATRSLDQGLYPRAFCKLYKDVLGNDDNWINVMHADGAGTKSILAYLYWKETGDISVWKGIAQDAIVMNVDDLLCVGIYKNLLYSSSIDRNKNVIPGEVLKTIIEGSQEFFDKISKEGIDITFLGGETADVGDVVRTIAVNGTMAARWKKTHLVTNEKIASGQVIVGLSSFGKASYEDEYNSGVGSNGLTSARHDILNKSYSKNYPETFDNSLSEEVTYIGKYNLTDSIKIEDDGTEHSTDIGKLILSPTRTYAPIIKEVLESNFPNIYGLIHCSGGGQTKCMKYMPERIRVVKDNLFQPPEIFQLIKESSRADDREMYQVFNMGCRLEIYTNDNTASEIIKIAERYKVSAQVIGYTESADKKELIIKKGEEQIVY